MPDGLVHLAFQTRSAMHLSEISVTILTKNSQKYLSQVLASVSSFGQVLIYDTGSSDNTLEIARKFPNVTIAQDNFVGFGPTHNLASAAAHYDWILSIDSDEVVTKEMVQAIEQAENDPHIIYAFPRNNYFNGKWIKWCGWYPDRQMRLYNKTKTQFSNAQVHEAIMTDGMQVFTLEAPMVHYSYDSIEEFITKMQSYSTLFAKQNAGKKRSSLPRAILHGSFAFFKSYILKRGFLGGYEGFVISAYNGHTAYYKYLKLREANLKLKHK